MPHGCLICTSHTAARGLGSRRLVARNRFRNTINAFNGLNAQWRSKGGAEARAFYTLPVQRLPRSASELHDGDVRFDVTQEVRWIPAAD